MGARLRTAGLFLLLTLVFVGFGWIIGTVFFGNWLTTVILFLVFAGIMNAISYFFADRIVLFSYRARPVTEADAPALYRIVQRVAAMNNLPMPRVYLVPSVTPNARAPAAPPRDPRAREADAPPGGGERAPPPAPPGGRARAAGAPDPPDPKHPRRPRAGGLVERNPVPGPRARRRPPAPPADRGE